MNNKNDKAELADKLRYPEAARLLGIPVGTLHSMVFRRQVPHIRLGPGPRLVVFSKAELETWLEEHHVRKRLLLVGHHSLIFRAMCSSSRTSLGVRSARWKRARHSRK